MIQTRRLVGPLCLCLFALCCTATLCESSVADSGPATPQRLKGIDLDGNLHRLGEGRKAVVLVFLSTECPISNSYIPRLNTISLRIRKKQSEFFAVISEATVTRDDAARYRRKYKVRFPVLFDASGDLRSALKPTHVPQAIVLDADGRVAYSGLIDDQYADLGRKRLDVRHHYLQNALDAIVTGEKPKIAKTTPIGCLIEPPSEVIKPGDVNYCRDIAPIVQTHCACCHRPGESAPFSLLTYDDVRKHSRQIAEVTRRRLMPPWKPVAGFGHFLGERRLSDREIRLFKIWSENGKPKGDAADLPPEKKFPTGWQLGTPDLIVTMAEPFRIPAEGNDILRHFVVPTGLTQGKLVSAMEFRPGNPRVVHHGAVFFDNSGIARRLDAADAGYGYTRFGGVGFPASGSLGNWLPGSTPMKLPKGAGRPMPKGSDLIMQLHYQTTGKPETDQSTVGIYFTQKSARQMVAEFQIFNTKLKIPPGAKRHHHHASYTLPTDCTIFDAAPHMHLLGREMKVTATKPDGTVVPMVWVKDWDFNWQGQYLYETPLELPRGTRIDVHAWLDNSAANPLNPNSPPKTVSWGEQTVDEMPLCQFRYTCKSLRDFTAMQEHYKRFLYSLFPAGQSPFGRPTF